MAEGVKHEGVAWRGPMDRRSWPLGPPMTLARKPTDRWDGSMARGGPSPHLQNTPDSRPLLMEGSFSVPGRDNIHTH